jgi:hypothetical protein
MIPDCGGRPPLWLYCEAAIVREFSDAFIHSTVQE